MRTLFGATAIAIAALATISTAQAADLPARQDYVKAPAQVVPAYNWTGIYVGVNGGWGWGNQDPLNLVTDRFDRFNVNFSGGMFGGTAGAQIQSGHVVIGLEADLDWANLSGSGIIAPSSLGTPTGSRFDASTKMDWVSTARARVGYAENNWLLYVTGGLALTHGSANLTTLSGANCSTANQPSCSYSSDKIGGTAGLGLEYGITPALSAKFEYLYIAAASLEISHINTVRLGLNYRFGGM